MNLWMFKQKINDIDGTENITERFELFRVWGFFDFLTG